MADFLHSQQTCRNIRISLLTSTWVCNSQCVLAHFGTAFHATWVVQKKNDGGKIKDKGLVCRVNINVAHCGSRSEKKHTSTKHSCAGGEIINKKISALEKCLLQLIYVTPSFYQHSYIHISLKLRAKSVCYMQIYTTFRPS